MEADGFSVSTDQILPLTRKSSRLHKIRDTIALKKREVDEVDRLRKIAGPRKAICDLFHRATHSKESNLLDKLDRIVARLAGDDEPSPQEVCLLSVHDRFSDVSAGRVVVHGAYQANDCPRWIRGHRVGSER